MPIPDAQELKTWSDEERAHMSRLLAGEIGSTHQAFSIFVLRQFSIALALGAAVLLIPWTMWLAYTLPITEKTQAWSIAWVGYDCILALVLLATAWFGFKRRQIALAGLVMSGTLLLIDAWFDVTFSWGTRGFGGAVLSAVIVEIPLGIILISSALLIMRRSATLVAKLSGQATPTTSLWRQKFLIDSATDDSPNA